MCRLFGLLSLDDEPAEPWLVRSERSLLAQSNVSPDTAQKDGWGVAWLTDGGRARIEKGTGCASHEGERQRFVQAAKDASGPLVLGHLRHASNPMHLSHEQLIGLANSQPFDTHTTLFVHNGGIPFPVETRPFLGLHESKVRGVNDSEVLFWLLVRNTEEHGDPLVGYVRTVEDLVRVWEAMGRPELPPFSALNVIFSRGPDELYAFAQWTGDHGSGLLDDRRRYFEMAYEANARRVVVGSEPFDRRAGPWKSLASGEYLHAKREDGRLEVTTGRTPLPDALELRPPPT
ncbi:MAG: class II glutamine amidotransferase [Thermoplasmata archaeon]